MEFIQREGTLFQPFIATEVSSESVEQYCQRMTQEGEWGGNPELYAAAKLFNIHIIVHQVSQNARTSVLCYILA